ncbi:MAG: hypothetical protein CM15mP120_19940 [Pseudomonadota bacterium]|nr:MAG: hypothetical protein CM15mP120_19940 [Pseudomonadota bacterium]
MAFIGLDFAYGKTVLAISGAYGGVHAAHHKEDTKKNPALRQTGPDHWFCFLSPMYLAPGWGYCQCRQPNLLPILGATEHVRRLGVLDYIFVTPSNHRGITPKTPVISTKITAAYLSVGPVWYLRGRGEDEPCRYGITHQLGVWETGG